MKLGDQPTPLMKSVQENSKKETEQTKNSNENTQN